MVGEKRKEFPQEQLIVVGDTFVINNNF